MVSASSVLRLCAGAAVELPVIEVASDLMPEAGDVDERKHGLSRLADAVRL